MPELEGTWVSVACELRPQSGETGVQPWYLKREVVFAGDGIDARFTTFGDAACSTPLLEIGFGGRVLVQGPSPAAPGAREVNLVIDDYLTFTPRSEGMVGFLDGTDPGDCGAGEWAVDEEQDVFDTGCSVMGVLPGTPTTEYELLHVASGHLYFGARPVSGEPLDTPEKRPTTFQIPLRLAEGGVTRRVGESDVRVPGVVEVVMFEQREGVDPDDVRAFFEQITEQMNGNDTLLYRTVARGDDGRWLCVNYWSSREAMEMLNDEAQNWTEVFADMGELARPDSFRLSSYDIGN